ncbi:MAG: hypothetical protein DKM22_04145 [Candidatus Melainabacteria bacterium]|nr:MAG: hypothetical protein DKM22_04145 [Candidatus Melainabacteria bacterium]
MSKRFVDTELWQKEWFQDLSLKEKILIKYIFENCDCAGVWNGNFKMASFIIGEKVSIKDLEEINKKKHQFDILNNNNIFVSDFIKFQYGELSEKCKPHTKVISMLKHYGLYERVMKEYANGIEAIPKTTRFIKPTIEEVSAYCAERKNGINAEAFINFYESKGWKIGKNSMKDWKAAVRTWESKNKPADNTEDFDDDFYMRLSR